MLETQRSRFEFCLSRVALNKSFNLPVSGVLGPVTPLLVSPGLPGMSIRLGSHSYCPMPESVSEEVWSWSA